jgi:hypothetical protein
MGSNTFASFKNLINNQLGLFKDDERRKSIDAMLQTIVFIT